MFEKVKSYIPLNFGLMASPVNWIVITLIVVLAGMALAAILPTDQPTE